MERQLPRPAAASLSFFILHDILCIKFAFLALPSCAGWYYFACSQPGHCLMGTKVAVWVQQGPSQNCTFAGLEVQPGAEVCSNGTVYACNGTAGELYPTNATCVPSAVGSGLPAFCIFAALPLFASVWV